jgi:hypothetical protein
MREGNMKKNTSSGDEQLDLPLAATATPKDITPPADTANETAIARFISLLDHSEKVILINYEKSPNGETLSANFENLEREFLNENR